MQNPAETANSFPLHEAAQKGDSMSCQKLLTAQYSARQLDDNYKEPLYYAAMGTTDQHLEIVQMLCARGSRLYYEEQDVIHGLLEIVRTKQIAAFLIRSTIDYLKQPSNLLDSNKVKALVISIYRTYKDYDQLFLNAANLELLNSLPVSDDVYTQLLQIFANNYEGVDPIRDAIGLAACKKALTHLEKSAEVSDLKNAGRLSYLIAFYYSDFETPPNPACDAYYQKAMRYYHRAGCKREELDMISDYARNIISPSRAIGLLKKSVLELIKDEQESLPDYFLIMTTRFQELGEINTHVLLGNLFDESVDAANSLTAFVDAITRELDSFDQLDSPLNKDDLRIMVSLFKHLSPDRQKTLAEIKGRINAILHPPRPVPSLKRLVAQAVGKYTESAGELVLIPRSQLRFFQEAYRQDKEAEQQAKRAKQEEKKVEADAPTTVAFHT